MDHPKRSGPAAAMAFYDRFRDRLLTLRPSTLPPPVHPPEPEERAAHRILNFALRAGGLMLSSGAGTVEVESTILSIAHACGLRECEVDVTFTSMTASYIRGDDVAPITIVRVVRSRSVDFGRLAEVDRLREELVAGDVSPAEAYDRLGLIAARRRPRRADLVTPAWAGMAAGFAVLLGGGALVGVVAFAATALVYLVNRGLAHWGIPDFFLAAIGAAVATTVAVGLAATGADVSTPLIVAGGLMVLVPGYALVASMQDALTGFPISGAARGLEVVLVATGIVTGVAIGLYVAELADVDVTVAGRPLASAEHIPVQVVAAAVASCLYAVATFVPRRSLIGAGLTGGLGWLVFLALVHAGVSLVVSTATAAIVVGLTGNLWARLQRTHPFMFIVPGVMPLVPGLTIYRGMLDLYYSGSAGSATLLRAAELGLAIAAGVVFGNLVMRPLRRPRRRTAPA